MKYSIPLYRAESGFSIPTQEYLTFKTADPRRPGQANIRLPDEKPPPVPGQDSRQRRLSKSTRNRRDTLSRLAAVLAEPPVLSLENHRRLQHLHRMPGP